MTSKTDKFKWQTRQKKRKTLENFTTRRAQILRSRMFQPPQRGGAATASVTLPTLIIDLHWDKFRQVTHATLYQFYSHFSRSTAVHFTKCKFVVSLTFFLLNEQISEFISFGDRRFLEVCTFTRSADCPMSRLGRHYDILETLLRTSDCAYSVVGRRMTKKTEQTKSAVM